jgi:hypothetical protein
VHQGQRSLRTVSRAENRRLGKLLVVAALIGGCVGNIGGDESGESFGSAGPPEAVPFAPAPATVHRLTQIQLGNSYRALFGDVKVPEDLPADDQLYGFTSIAAAARSIAPLEAEKYETAAYAVIDQLWASRALRAEFVGCTPSTVEDPCVTTFLEDFVSRAWRRPVGDDEVKTLQELGARIAEDLGDRQAGDPWRGISFVLGAVLQSPHFLFRIDIGVADPDTGLMRYTGWEMASRLSFLLANAPPDDELRRAAREGELDGIDGIRAQAERLVEAMPARTALVGFFREFMGIGRLDIMTKDQGAFPMFTATLGPAMRIEIERMFEDVVFEQQGDFRQLFTSRDTFVNEELANLYGLEVNTGASHAAATFPDDGRRAGLLTTAGFLAMNAHQTATSPTNRGRFVRVNLLCEEIPPPPPGVDTSIPEPEPGVEQTMRERLEEHRENPQCQSCHESMDPIGFALEHYDALGRWRDLDNGLPIDAATSVDGQPVDGGVELGALVASLPEVGACIAKRFYRHANGRLEVRGDDTALEALVEDFVAGDYDFKRLVIDLVVNDGFRYAGPRVD